jgi:hypothetical protein
VDFSKEIDTDGDIKVIDLKGGLRERPLESSEATDPTLEFRPKGWVGRKPNANATVDISLVDGKARLKAVGHGQFVDSVVDCCIYHGWWHAHCSATELVPVCVPKLEDVTAHYEFQGGHRSFD